MAYWLMKSEPLEYGLADLQRDGSTIWDGVRNYQARNFLRQMRLRERAFFYHSNASPPGIFGLMELINKRIKLKIRWLTPANLTPTVPDPKSPVDNPRWWTVEVGYVQTCTPPLTLDDLRRHYDPAEFLLLRPGNRWLSVLPVPAAVALDIAAKTGLRL